MTEARKHTGKCVDCDREDKAQRLYGKLLEARAANRKLRAENHKLESEVLYLKELKGK